MKNLLLFADRQEKAGDNAEIFYKYLINDIRFKNYEKIYAISNKSPDYERLKKIGFKIVNYDDKNLMKSLYKDCKVLISSHNDLNTDPNKLFLFLGHGDWHGCDIAKWYLYGHNFTYYTTGQKMCFEMLSKVFKDNRYKFTGLARYDELERLQKIYPVKKQILIHLSMRHDLKKLSENKFKESVYFKTLNSLLNNKLLLQIVNENKYEIAFCLHPVMEKFLKTFNIPSYIKIIPLKDRDYNKLFCESSILITDYSSVTHDMGYLNKPTFYIQDTSVKVRDTLVYTGYGPKSKTVEELINNIKKYLDNNCMLDEVYKNNLKNFNRDGNSCKRIADLLNIMCK